jgi:hypothetical protein
VASEEATVPSISSLIAANLSIKKLTVEPVPMPMISPLGICASAAWATDVLSWSCDMASLLDGQVESSREILSRLMK